jgi:ribosomal protein S18 acetylase RimI-like enzyme
MEIRLMTPEDYDAVYDLWCQTAGMRLRSSDDTREGIAKFIKKNPTSNFVAVKNSEIVGVIMCGMDGRRAYIYHTTVKESLRGQGIGKAMLKKVYEAIRAAGIHKNGLLVIKDNEIGKGFWRSQGWEERHDVLYYSINME